MNRIDIMEKVILAVRQHQEMSGRSIDHLDGNTCPIGGVEGFDSLSAEEATLILSDLLGHDIPETVNPFVAKSGNRANTVNQVAHEVCAILGVE